MSTINVDTLSHSSGGKENIILNADGTVTLTLSGGGGDTPSGDYLRTDADAPAQVVKSTNPTEFTSSVSVSGGNVSPVINLRSDGIIQNAGIEFNSNKTSAIIESRGIVYSSSKKALLSVNRPNAGGDNVDIFLARTDNTQYDANGNRTPVNVAKSTSFKAESPLGNAAGDYGSYDSYVGFHATSPGNTNNDAAWTGNKDSYGFLSGVSSRTEGTGQTFGFYASGDSPNYFSGNTYIGGATTRNTLELWKSTLTEEQLEELTAGTLVAPANVSVPGDGSFARQWWYNQQDAETQALIDADELAYPTNLLPDDFVDNFVLGDNTNINLLSTGTALLTAVGFKGTGLPSRTNNRGIVNRGFDGLLLTNRADTDADDVNGLVARVDCRNANGDIANLGDIVCLKAEAPSGAQNDAAAGTYQDWVGLSILNGQGSNRFRGNKIAIRSTIENWASGSYNIFADGGAPNYFSGNTYIGGTTSSNTLALWLSTLTEEQIEQYNAGTFTAPADVTTPGDGTFARQWWYNQQDAETQELIDSGELDYPENLQPANFTDAFALGDNTNINLLSNGRGEFANGVKVTGGYGGGLINGIGSAERDELNIYAEGLTKISCKAKVVNLKTETTTTGLYLLASSDPCDTSGNQTFGIRNIPRLDGQLNSNTYYHYVADSASNTGDLNEGYVGAGNQVGFDAPVRLERNTTGVTFGFRSAVANANNFNFAAFGDAPNYFAGNVLVNASSGYVSSNPGFRARSSSTGGTDSGLEILSSSSNTNAARNALLFTKRDSNDVEATAVAGLLKINGGIGSASSITLVSSDGTDPFIVTLSDYRTKSLSTFASPVSTVVKQLNPGSNGFIAHEVAEVIPSAVMGTKDATEAIGTLADYDGTVLKTAVVEPEAEELTYTEEVETNGVATMVSRQRTWTSTGTRPVYQGVDQTKLIPLLTKALQEALERIEALEAALSNI